MKNIKKPALLLIMDGYGLSDEVEGNAVAQADTPNLDCIFAQYPNSKLSASGEDVGLPKSQMGNSEVGHMNIGAGRPVYQELLLITKRIESGEFFKNPAFLSAVAHAKQHQSSLHLLGLVSDGGVHSHIEHLKALLLLAKRENIQNVYVHTVLDGRDVPPRCAIKYIDELETFMSDISLGEIASISGRYYTMDRDKRWERIKSAYDMMVCGEALEADSAKAALNNAYERGESDEFVKPTLIVRNKDKHLIKSNDAVIMFNFRPDRAREISRTLAESAFDGFDRNNFPVNLKYVCMTRYDASFENVEIAYPPEKIKNTLGEYISNLGLKQLRIAETEKYAHVTFFFNGGIEEPYPNEHRILIPSPKVATYDLQPEMSAYELTDKLLPIIKNEDYDLIIVNFANPDMVGHTGIMSAAVKAVEAVDFCVGKIINAVIEKGGFVLLTADHGNADTMQDKDGRAITSHSLNPVPFAFIYDKEALHEHFTIRDGKLCDIAPTLLNLIDLPVPVEMSGKNLISIG